VREAVSGEPIGLTQRTLRWLLEHVSDEIGALVDSPGHDWKDKAPWPFGAIVERFVTSALWSVPGSEGVQWFMRRLEHQDAAVGSDYQAMRGGRLPDWDADDWTARLDALSEAAIEPRPAMLQVFGLGRTPPPRSSSAAQVRLACVYTEDPTDYLLRTVVKNVRGYRTGDPEADLSLFWWAAPPEHHRQLRWALELAGPPGGREALVDAAAHAGLLDEAHAQELRAPLQRPAWADGDVRWEIAEIVDAGAVRTPDGRIGAGDPWWSFEGVPLVVTLAPGRYRVRVVVADHPLYGRENAAAELQIDPTAPIQRWQLIDTAGAADRAGYISEVGVGSFGAVETLDPGILDQLPDRILGERAASAEVDAGDAGSLVVFTIGPQHHDCRTWAGLTSEGKIARLVTELGPLHFDLATSPPPWEA
jgi:hypothetical protein